MKKVILLRHIVAFILLVVGSLPFYSVGSDRWILPTEEGDWAQKEAAARQALEQEPVRIRVAEPSQAKVGEESEEALLARIMAQSEREQKEADEKRKQESAQEEELLRQVVEASAQEEEQRQREAEEFAQAIRISAAQEEKRQEQQRLAQEREEKALAARQTQAVQERENKELAAALKAIADMEKAAEEQVLNKQIADFEQAAQEQSLKESAPFFAAYEQAIAPTNTPHIKIIRPAVIQQKALECGYFAAINGALIYNAFRSPIPGALTDITLPMLADQSKMEQFLRQAGNRVGCPRGGALDAGDIITVLADLFNIPLDHSYSIYYDQLPDDLTKLDASNKDIINVLQTLSTQPGFTHIFFLRKAGADVGQATLGHWIAVVAHNNNNQNIDLYVLDSQYPQSSSISDQNHRMNHDKMWQALAILLYQAGQQRVR